MRPIARTNHAVRTSAATTRSIFFYIYIFYGGLVNVKLCDDESEGEGEEERLDDQMVKGRRLCVPASTVVNGELPLNFAAKLSKWTEAGYRKIQKRELRALMDEPGAGGADPGCVLM